MLLKTVLTDVESNLYACRDLLGGRGARALKNLERLSPEIARNAADHPFFYGSWLAKQFWNASDRDNLEWSRLKGVLTDAVLRDFLLHDAAQGLARRTFELLRALRREYKIAVAWTGQSLEVEVLQHGADEDLDKLRTAITLWRKVASGPPALPALTASSIQEQILALVAKGFGIDPESSRYLASLLLPLAWTRAEHTLLFPVVDLTTGATDPAGGDGLVCATVWSSCKVEGLTGLFVVPWSRLDLDPKTRDDIVGEIAKDSAHTESLFLVDLDPVENPSVSLRARTVRERSLTCAVLAAALAAERGMDLKLAVATADAVYEGPDKFGLREVGRLHLKRKMKTVASLLTAGATEIQAVVVAETQRGEAIECLTEAKLERAQADAIVQGCDSVESVFDALATDYGELRQYCLSLEAGAQDVPEDLLDLAGEVADHGLKDGPVCFPCWFDDPPGQWAARFAARVAERMSPAPTLRGKPVPVAMALTELLRPGPVHEAIVRKVSARAGESLRRAVRNRLSVPGAFVLALHGERSLHAENHLAPEELRRLVKKLEREAPGQHVVAIASDLHQGMFWEAHWP